MGARVSTLKAIFTAETGQAEAGFRRMGAQTNAFAEGAKGAFDGLGLGIAQFAGPAGVGLAVAGLVKGALAANDLREQFKNTERQLTAYAGSTAAAKAATQAFVEATDGGVTKVDAMRMSSQLLGMGLTTTADEVGQMARMAAMLGDKTLSVQERMENWNAMMANQSLPRLDTYGISSGRVRQRIDEQMAANAGLSREQAFTNAVLEIGGEKLRQLEAQGVDVASSTDQLRASVSDLGTSLAQLINLEDRIRGVAGAIREVADLSDGVGALSDALDPSNGAGAQIAAIEARLAQLTDLRDRYESGEHIYRFNAQGNAAEIEALETRAQNLRLYGAEADAVREKLDAYLTISRDVGVAQEQLNTAVMVGDEAQAEYARASLEALQALQAEKLAAYQAAAGVAASGQAARDAAKDYDNAAASMLGLAAAQNAAMRGAPSGPGTGNYAWYQGGSNSFYGNMQDAKIKDDLAYAREVRAERDRQRAEEERENAAAARKVGTAYSKSLTDAARDFQDEMKSAMQAAQQDSIGLLDLRPGQGNPNAPGAGGAFEDVFRLQAYVKDGSWGETAAKHGLDQAGASEAVKKFQLGQWDESVLKLIDKGKLSEQIQQAQLGKAMMDALATDLAKENAADPKLVKAMLMMPGGSDGGTGAASAAGMDLSGFTQGFLGGVDKEIAANGEDLAKRGAALWDALGGGFIKAASTSGAFKAAVAGLVAEALAGALE